MPLGGVSVTSRDGGIGVRGPAGVAQWAAIGVASEAAAVATQEPLVITGPADAETQLGLGPLRDLMVAVLSSSGGSVLVMPLQRGAGGVRIGTGAIMSGVLNVTPNATRYTLGQQHVRLECVTGGSPPAAQFRLVVDGVPGAIFTPVASEYGSDLPATRLTAAVLGSLADGVPTSDQVTFSMVTGTFVAGQFIEWRYGEPKATGANYTTGIDKLVSHRRTWEFVHAAGTVTGATMALINTAVDIEDQGRYLFAVTQTPGHDARSGGPATAMTLAAWITATVGGITGAPSYQSSPRLQICGFHDVWDDPITGRERVWPSSYGYTERLVRRQPQEPAEAFRYGAKGTARPGAPSNCKSIYGLPTETQIAALDDINICTSRHHDGVDGVFVTRSRMWGQPAAPGVDGTDYSGSYRRRVMDEACRRVRRAVREFFGDEVATDANGRIAPGAQARIEGRANSALQSLTPQAISASRATVRDTDPGILVSEELLVDLDITPRGFVGNIRATVGFRIGFGAEEAA